MTQPPNPSAPTPRRGMSRRVSAWVALLLVLVNLAAFHRAIGWQVFYNSDSDVMLGVAREAGWREAWGWITGPWLGASLCNYYRPTSSWLIWGEWQVFGTHGAGYQAAGLLIHVGATLLFWRIAALLLGGEMLAVIAALIFGLRPLNLRTVAVLTAQPDLVAVFLMFLSLLLLLLYLRAGGFRPHLAVDDSGPCPQAFAGSPSGKRPALLIASLIMSVLALGGKEMAASLPVLASLVIAFDRQAPAWRKVWLAAAYWVAAGGFLAWRTVAMSGVGYVPGWWRDPGRAVAMCARNTAMYYAYPFAAPALMGDWWPLAMLVIIAGGAAAAWRWPLLRRPRVIVYGMLVGFAAAALGLAAVFYETWAVALSPSPWRALGPMLVYTVGAVMIIARRRRAALFLVLWGLFVYVPVAYRVYNWSGKFDYLPQTWWALVGALLVEAVAAAGGCWGRWRMGRAQASQPA